MNPITALSIMLLGIVTGSLGTYLRMSYCYRKAQLKARRAARSKTINELLDLYR